MKKEYASSNTLYHLSNGITISFFNEYTPLVFFCGIKEIGRYNLAASIFTADEIINMAEKISYTDLVNFFG